MITFLREPFIDPINAWFDFERSSSDPQTKIVKNDGEYKLLMSLPGLSKEDIKISVKDQVVKISYSKEEKTESSQFIKNFSRQYSLPDNIKESGIEAKLENGILEMKFPFEKKKLTERLIELM